MVFHPGQRWISDSESEQGLGTVVAVEHRFVTVLFTATGESRQYAIVDAPLTRVKFNVGDVVPSHEGWLITVAQVEQLQHQFQYIGNRHDTQEQVTLKEVMIDHFIKFNKPHDRLLNGQIDRLDWYRLRRDCLQHQFQQQKSALSGLVGGRVSLIPHQLYIAEEVGQRFAPRVLLADEVGLGKTIEAGLIIHQQLVSGRAQRILIVVPEPLMHQWLVEMLRRFNLHFSIFDEERCQQTDGENPFSQEQLVLVSLSFLTEHNQWYEALLAEQWDLMVVDEAHHLDWHEQQPSLEYQCIEQLAQHIAGILLLTATPDQLGHQSHFARLKLLDPDRFYDYPAFVEEEQHYADVAQTANLLLADQILSAQHQQTLTSLFKETDITHILEQCNQPTDELRGSARRELLSQLLDRHGTGRILFRNSRHTIKGFPERQLIASALTLPEQYSEQLDALLAQPSAANRQALVFTPERLYSLAMPTQQWTDFDPRVDYLVDLLANLQREKLLVICAHAQTAIDLEQVLRVKQGIRAAIFHEGLSILERDKAAAYFAQSEDSAQILLCSEIGSEGRNFQFAHHMVLFDLPINPDLLEQRIGRLDRIGQNQTIHIHVPYFANSPAEFLFQWYQQSLQAFEHTCITGRAVFDAFGDKLMLLIAQAQWQSAQAQQLLNDSHAKHLELKQKLEAGRDKLLELHSSGQGKAEALVDNIAAQDQQTALPQFMFQLFDVYGIAQDDKADNSIALNPTEHMISGQFPCLPEEGTTITFDRDTALAYENYQLLTWDHPMVRDAIDLILSEQTGNASIGLLKNPALPVGTFFLECLFTLEASAPSKLQLNRYLPATPIRVLVDSKGNNLADKIAEPLLDKQLMPVKKVVGLQLAKALATQIPNLVSQAEQQAQQQVENIQQSALTQMHRSLQDELQRLTALAAINPNVRPAEIEFIQLQQAELQHYINKAQLKFEAVRLIVVSQ